MTEITQTPSSMDELEVGMALKGKVKRIELFGAFVDIGVGMMGCCISRSWGVPMSAMSRTW